ncbi:MAG TPA: class I SAM-dependent methyltransferase [Actinomycetota bacterium]|nr:class I SAM-dependent methyltransferase [Actinomycetota bacterium]
MPWSWIRPADHTLLKGRPLLDIGTGDGQTVANVSPGGLIVGVDHAPEPLLRSAQATGVRTLRADALRLPFKPASFGAAFAADLFHHLDDDGLRAVLSEGLRVVRPGAPLVAWWYLNPGRPGPGSPPYPRPYDLVASVAAGAGWRSVEPLQLEPTLEPAPPTAGLVARGG